MASIEGRKKRIHRLIERGAILESFIDRASEKSNEEIKGKVHSLPFTLDHENLKRVIFAKSTY